MADFTVTVVILDPDGSTSAREAPLDEFEAGERGVTVGTTLIPWHRVVRYTVQTRAPGAIDLDDDREAPSTVRVWIDDLSSEGERLEARSDRTEQGPWSVTLVVDETVDVDAGVRHIRKLTIPWNRVLELERVRATPRMPVRPDGS
jgi:uncharacterized protein (UPF0248 family)